MSEYQVFVKADDCGRIMAVNSSAFLLDTTGWTQVDSGTGDKFHHAQGNYLPQPIMDDRGICRYKLENGNVVARTAEEMDADYVEPDHGTSLEARVNVVEIITGDLEEALNMILTGVTE